MRNKIYFIVLLSLALFSCTDEEIVSVKSGVLVSGSLQQSTSRTAYEVGDNSVSVSWEAGDAIGIMSASQTDPLEYTALSSASVTDFQAAGTEVSNDESETYYAWYPYYSGAYGDSYPLAALPNIYSQKYTEGEFPSSYDFIYGSGQIADNQLNFSFSHLFTFVKIIIDPSLLEDAYGFMLSGDEIISVYTRSSSPAYYNLNTGEITGTQYVFLSYMIDQKYIEEGELLTCYIAMLPSSEDNTIKISKLIHNGSYYTNGDVIYIKDAPEGGFKAGRMYTLYIGESSLEELLAKEREALIALYDATDGDNWTNNENWCTDADISEWYGVTVSSGLVSRLELNENNLTGSIPSDIGQLTQLQYLRLDGNSLSGEIPEEIYDLRHLYGLYLGGNSLSGEISSAIGELTNLYYLYLYDNNLSGEIPEEIGNLTSLYYLSIYSNNFSGSIPESIGNLTSLVNLNLRGNQLSGTIPSSVCSLTNLKYLRLYDNELSGEIPEDIGNLTALTILNLSDNELSGEIPTSIGNLTSLTTLDLSGNDLTGNLPTSMAALSALESIDVTMNKLQGEVPEEIINCEWWSNLGYTGVLPQQNGYGLTLPYSLHDWTVHTLQEHTQGDGIKFIIVGEAYSQDLIDDGTYAEHVGWAYDALFSEEPYASFQDYFDVWYVDIPSEESTFGGNTAFGVYYDTSDNSMTVDNSLILEVMSKLEEANYTYKNLITIVLVNCSLSKVRSVCFSGSSFAIAYCRADTETYLKQVVHHEALGHGFGKLADEYVEYDEEYPDVDLLAEYHGENMRMNVDTISDPEEVLWSYFLQDSRYDDEELGIFEGAAYYATGIYRPRNTSIMRYNTGGFNAPSRQEIYRRIMEMSGEGYTFENFLEYDEINRQTFATGSAKSRNVEPEFTGVLGAPPVFIEDD